MPPPPPGWWGNDQAPRAGRGDARLMILDALSDKPRHGYQIIQAIEDKTDGAYKPSPGTVYPTLQMLEEMELIEPATEEGKRKAYQLTDAGKAELEANREKLEDAYDRLRGPSHRWESAQDLHDVARRLRRLMRGVSKAFRRGVLGPRKLSRIEAIVRDAATKIEEVLDD